jgi:GNAT superfamily N-acetyltransferase
MVSPHDTLNLPRQLEGGLILRLATPADTETLAEFNDQIHLEEDEPPGWLGIWTRDLMSGRHPTTSAADFVIVEDPSMNHKIVSATCLIPQVWRYKEIPFEVGRPELVGTDPAYRRRGLARIVFDQIHALSAAYGHMVQGITGIEWFYRQFGYEYALPLGGTRVLPIDGVPALDENEPEPFQVRPATEADVPTMMRLYDRHSATKLVTAVIGEAHWHWDLTGRSEGSMPGYRFFCVVDRDQQVLGYYVTPPLLWKQQMTIFELGTDEGISIPSILPTVLRALKKQGERYAAKLEKKGPTGIGLALGLEHPAYEVVEGKLVPYRRPYAWYVRVPDLPAFIRHIAPVLERRLAQSLLCGYSGDLDITFYHGGLKLTFAGGKLTAATGWRAPESNEHWTGAGFPPLVFLKLLFGYRSLDELRDAYPDCWASDEPGLLLKALFPKRVSWVQPLA